MFKLRFRKKVRMPLTITEVLDILELYFQQEQRGTITRAEFSSLSK